MKNTIEIETENGKVEIERIQIRRGYTVDGDGYTHDTHNVEVGTGYDSDQNRYCYAMDNGTVAPFGEQTDECVISWLCGFDADDVEVFLAENILCDADVAWKRGQK